MEKEDNIKEERKGNMKDAAADNQAQPGSSTEKSQTTDADKDSEVVKEENIPVTYIDTSPDVPSKEVPKP